jgi:LacI family transcriptional regulator
MEKNKRLSDIAKIAEVSVSTVSRVLGGRGRVGNEVEARVRAVAEQLGIDLAQRRKKRVISLILGNLEVLTEFQARLLVGAEAYLAQQDWDLHFVSHHYNLAASPDEVSLPQVVTRPEPVSGIILGNLHSASLLQALQTRRIPFSVLGNNVVGDWRPESFDAVFADDLRGAREITEHLILQGHRDIWYIGNWHLPWYARCGEGYRRAMLEAGLEPHLIDFHSQHQELGYLSAKSVLTEGKPVTVFFAGNDQAASGAYQAVYELGMRIPEDISIVGFNDTLGNILHPGLTTVREFPEQLGQHLAEFTLRRIQNPSLPPQQLTVATQLVRRYSVRPILASTSLGVPGGVHSNLPFSTT